jgi:hypothetical protein
MEGYMKPEVKQMWLEALRSGKYKQGKEQLRDGDKFCCLGVLCELSGLPYLSNDGTLPSDVMEWAGLDRTSPTVKYKSRFAPEYLSDLNDRGNYGFKRIANLIERYL